MPSNINDKNEPTSSSYGKIIYDREQSSITNQPEFKPGNTPHTQYGDKILNGNVPWSKIIEEIQAHYTQERLVKKTGVTPATLRKISKGNYSSLDFRTGAKILGVHCLLYPSQY